MIPEPKLTLTLCFKTLPILNLDDLLHRLAQIEPLLHPPCIMLDKQDPLYTWILFEQDDPLGDGFPHTHSVIIEAENAPIPETKLEQTHNTLFISKDEINPRNALIGHTAQLRCTYYSGGSPTAEPMIALYKIAYCLLDSGLMGVWDEFIRVCHAPDTLRAMFSRPIFPIHLFRPLPPPDGLWTNILEFHRPGGGIWFYTKGQHRFGLPDFAFLGPPTHKTVANQLFRELTFAITEHKLSFQVGKLIDVRPDLYISINGLLEYPEILDSPTGTLVLQIHRENVPDEELDDPFQIWILPQN